MPNLEEDDLKDDEEPDEFDPDDEDESDTRPCPLCGRDVYEDANRCPHCGEYIVPGEAERARRPWWVVVAAVLALLGVLSWTGC